MLYLSSSFRLARLRLALCDALVGVALATWVVRWSGIYWAPWYPLAVPIATLLAVLVLEGWAVDRDLGRERLARLFTAAVAAGLIAYPALAGFDRFRIRLTVLVILGLFVGVVLVRLLPGHRKRRPDDAIVVLGSDGARRRFEADRGELERAWRLERVLDVRDDVLGPEQARELVDSRPSLLVLDLAVDWPPDMVRVWLGARGRGLDVVSFGDFYAATTGRLPVELFEVGDLLRDGLRRTEGSPARDRVRRLAELVIGVTLGIVMAPWILVLAVVLRLVAGAPVFYVQERLGRHKRPFRLFKFRTMALDAEPDGPRWAQPGDRRVHPLGRLLRRTHLDELPQVWNLIRGEIGLIGPRPIRAEPAAWLAEESVFYDLRFLVRPGITGWSQILGPYGSNVEEQLVKLELDLYYLKCGTLADDVFILLRTLRSVVGRSGL